MPDTGDKRINLDIEDHLAVITISRPEKLNALDYEMVLALERAAHVVDGMDAIRCCIIKGEGEKSFCAGGDIEAWSSWSPENFGLAWVRHGHRAFDALARLRVPLIAALNGHALGGGLELAATADFRIAEIPRETGFPGNRSRHHSRMVRNAADSAPFWFANRPPHGLARRNLLSRRSTQAWHC